MKLRAGRREEYRSRVEPPIGHGRRLQQLRCRVARQATGLKPASRFAELDYGFFAIGRHAMEAAYLAGPRQLSEEISDFGWLGANRGGRNRGRGVGPTGLASFPLCASPRSRSSNTDLRCHRSRLFTCQPDSSAHASRSSVRQDACQF
jgi:hypothetical protein